MKKTVLAALAVALALAAVQAVPSADAAPSKEMKVRKLIELTGGEDLGKQVLDMMLTQLAQTPGIQPDFVEKFRELAMKDDLVTMYVPIYLKHVNEEDLDAAIAFFSTPAGRRFAKAQPAIMQDSMSAGQEWGARLAQRAQKELESGRSAAPAPKR